jgi:hypothetical protein
MNRFSIFLISAFISIFTLLIERSVGIGWDYHPDAVTYVTTSAEVSNVIFNNNILQIFNNAYYVWAYMFNQNIYTLTTINIIIFSLTNVWIFSYHKKNADKFRSKAGIAYFSLFVIMMNPYRLHLSTTILKDTMIIGLLVFMTVSKIRYSGIIFPIIFAFRVASAFYLAVHLRRNQLIIVLIVSMMIAAVYSNLLIETLLQFNSADMQMREYDTIPKFQNLGLIGVFARAVVWPILATTGLFAVVSPAAAFFPVALGSIANQFYCYINHRRLAFPLAIFVPMAIFGALVTGYTSYIRYIYPLLIVLPIVATRNYVSVKQSA